MSARLALRSTLVFCVIILLSTLVVGSVVSAKEDPLPDSFLAAPPAQTIQGGSPVPGGPGFISVSTYAFSAFDSTMKLSHSGGWMYNNETTPGQFVAPLNLPHGATLTKVLFFYSDFVATDMSFALFRANSFDGSIEMLAQSTSSGSTGNGYVERPVLEPVVNNQLYSYFLWVLIPGNNSTNLRLVNVRIDYDYPIYLPTVQN